MKTIGVKGCGDCLFLCRDQETWHISEAWCRADLNSPTQLWDCLEKAIPAECPLRVEGIIVELEAGR